MNNGTLNLALCSLAELVVMRQRTKRAKFPNRYAELVAEIQKREANITAPEKQQFRNRMKHNRNVRLFVVAVFMVVFPAPVISLVESAFNTFRSRNWTSTQCVVIERTYKSLGRPGVTYSYIFNNRECVADYWDSYSASLNRKEWLIKYRNKPKPRCFVNPTNPRESVIDRLRWEDLIVLAMCIGIVFMSYEGLRFPEQIRFSRRNPWTEEELTRLDPKNRTTFPS